MSSSSSSPDRGSQYLVVEFLGSTADLKSVDLVRQSWTFNKNRQLMCRYPPQKDEHKVRNWVSKGKDPQENWPVYPIKIISTAENFEQGERRLQRSYTTTNVNSSEPEKTKQRASSLLNNVDVRDALSQVHPFPTILSCNNKKSSHSQRLNKNATMSDGSDDGGDKTEDLNNNENNLQLDDLQIQNEDTNSNLQMTELKKFITSELERIKRSIQYDLKNRIDNLQSTIHAESAKRSNAESPWKILGTKLPNETLEDFILFEESLIDISKQDALKEIFHLVTVGSTSYERDVHTIISKIINKSVQLLYSGAGRKTKGQAKKSFQETQTYKSMDEFLKKKYENSSKQIKVLTVASHYLSGAPDREGGRKSRIQTNS